MYGGKGLIYILLGVGNVCATPYHIVKFSDNSRNYPPFSEYLYELCGIVIQLSPRVYYFC